MKRMNVRNVVASKSTGKSWRGGILRDQRGFNVLEFLIFVAFILLLALIVIPNINLFTGVDNKIAAANIEAFNVRSAAMAYEQNHSGKYPADSDALWSNPTSPSDYIGQPRAYYTFDIGTGRILDATIDTTGHVPTNPWAGIIWDFTSGSWVKQ